jgi:hypothetical protein
MSKLDEYTDWFGPVEVPNELARLIEFDEGQVGFYSQSFEIDCSSYLDGAMLKTYSEEPEFIAGFREFAQADGTGSTYAIWCAHGAAGDAPVVAFGSEGGVQLVAQNMCDFLRILTLDTEPMISWKKITYYKSDSDKPSKGAADYAKWLQKTFHLKPVADAAEVGQIVEKARNQFEKPFRDWMKRFVAE